MVFSSLFFLCVFLPAALFLHTVMPSVRLKNAVLLAASILFYAFGEPVYVVLLLISALVNWVLAIGIGRKGHGKGFLALAVVINLAFLGVFKYAAFLVTGVNALLHTAFAVPRIALPIGISFYTFQAMSYVIDVYRGQCRVQRSYFRLLLYIACFPQLIAGPIVRYRDVEDALACRSVTVDSMASGIRRFLFGLARKVLIANYCGVIADTIFAAPASDLSAPAAWLAAFAYLLQIYFDFSGYSDMAIGLGRMFGFSYMENFNDPYMAGSIREFWRRWHISLSTWLREYLYIPLGGNRRGRLRTVLNKMIVFVCCGIWHGANVTFLFWGFYHGVLQLIEELIPFFRRQPSSAAGKVLSRLYTVIAVMIGFVFFRADTMAEGFRMTGAMLRFAPASSPGAAALLWSVLTPAGIAAMAAGTAASFPLRRAARRLPGWERAADVLSLLLGAACVLNLAGGTYNPFLYFRF